MIVVDNYDSFTYNLCQVKTHTHDFYEDRARGRPLRGMHAGPLDITCVLRWPAQYLGDLGCEHIVLKNDEKTVEEIADMQPRGILVSPGPGEGGHILHAHVVHGVHSVATLS